MPVFERKLVPRMMSYWQESLLKTSALCLKICHFLSNSGSQMSCRVMTCVAWKWPDNILTFLSVGKAVRATPCGKLECFMRHQEAPESRRMQNNLLTCIDPMVLTMQLVAGVLFVGMVMWLVEQELILWSGRWNVSRVSVDVFPTEL